MTCISSDLNCSVKGRTTPWTVSCLQGTKILNKSLVGVVRKGVLNRSDVFLLWFVLLLQENEQHR